ncbi:MAG: nitroreductase family protein [Spirochaetes bacterium]|nr:nitroreductase family protein [Spirochaetota bacterium]
MNIRRIDDTCSNCGLCVRDCVAGVWRMVDGKPEPVAPDLCNRCSHCIAVCPRDAIVHDGLDAAQAVRTKRADLKPDAYLDIVLSRRSIRQFREKPVPREIIEKIINCARYAPTASNDQDVGYIVITDEKIIRNAAGDLFGFLNRLYAKTQRGILKYIITRTGLAENRYLKVMEYARQQNAETGRDFMLYSAPVVLLLHTPKRSRFGTDNCAIAATTIINYAHALGLGTCYIGFMTLALRYSRKMRKHFRIPRGRMVHATLVMGYPAYSHARTVSRKKAEIRWM